MYFWTTRRLPLSGQEQTRHTRFEDLRYRLRFQPVDATHWLNRSAGASIQILDTGSRTATRYF